MNTQVNIGIVIPAAGSSSRMGKPKQLLPWMETTLLGNCVAIAQSICDKVILVTGAYRNEIEDQVEKFKVDTVYSLNWEEGLGKSIAVGVGHLVEKYQDIDGILILLPDQPFITQEYLEKMVEQFSNKENLILATQYDKKDYGVPVMFPEKYFEELKQQGKVEINK